MDLGITDNSEPTKYKYVEIKYDNYTNLLNLEYHIYIKLSKNSN